MEPRKAQSPAYTVKMKIEEEDVSAETPFPCDYAVASAVSVSDKRQSLSDIFSIVIPLLT